MYFYARRGPAVVEVDVFWSYGIGAGFAFASARHDAPGTFGAKTFEGTPFRDTLLFLACCFAPSGVALLWAFPDWETMHLGTRELPHWLVALFAATNLTQGVLGFAVTRWLVATGRPFAAYLQWVLGYGLMFFILVHGWDGSGYQRFLSPTASDLPGWSWSTAQRWLTSPVAHTLEVEGLFIVPPILWLTSRWVRRGWAARGLQAPLSQAAVALQTLAFSVLLFPALAVVASALIRAAGWPLGLTLFALTLWALGLRRHGLLHAHFLHWHEGRALFTRAPAPLVGVTS
jgi:hypothetical protein